jgi:mgtE-like transporter
VLVYALPTFVLLGVSADVAANVANFHGPGLFKMVEVSVVGGLMATGFAVVIGYYAAVFTHRLGLDPDNHGIAVVTSTLDLFGAFSLILAIVLVGLR